LAEHNTNKFIEGILQVWLTKVHLDGTNVSKYLERLMQLLIALQLKPHVVINSINKFIENKSLMTKKLNYKKVCIL